MPSKTVEVASRFRKVADTPKAPTHGPTNAPAISLGCEETVGWDV
jgi:hypothetical protein